MVSFSPSPGFHTPKCLVVVTGHWGQQDFVRVGVSSVRQWQVPGAVTASSLLCLDTPGGLWAPTSHLPHWLNPLTLSSRLLGHSC